VIGAACLTNERNQRGNARDKGVRQ
jgi:hypothetical protein